MGEVWGLRRCVATALFALSALFALGGRAAAEVLWCQDDPILTVEGRTVNVESRFAMADVASLTEPVLYEVFVPSNVGEVLVVHLPSPVASRVTVTHSLEPWSRKGDLPMVIHVTVTATRDFPTWVSVFGPAVEGPFTVSGSSNTATLVSFGMKE
jgi:hypothetical protein